MFENDRSHYRRPLRDSTSFKGLTVQLHYEFVDALMNVLI